VAEPELQPSRVIGNTDRVTEFLPVEIAFVGTGGGVKFPRSLHIGGDDLERAAAQLFAFDQRFDGDQAAAQQSGVKLHLGGVVGEADAVHPVRSAAGNEFGAGDLRRRFGRGELLLHDDAKERVGRQFLLFRRIGDGRGQGDFFHFRASFFGIDLNAEDQPPVPVGSPEFHPPGAERSAGDRQRGQRFIPGGEDLDDRATFRFGGKFEQLPRFELDGPVDLAVPAGTVEDEDSGVDRGGHTLGFTPAGNVFFGKIDGEFSGGGQRRRQQQRKGQESAVH